MSGYIYLASPYSHPEPEVMEARYQQALRATAELMLAHDFPFSPIVHCHEIAVKFDLPRDFNYWQRYDRTMLTGATRLYVLDIEGWKESIGVRAEIEFARELEMSIWLMRLRPKLGFDVELSR